MGSALAFQLFLSPLFFFSRGSVPMVCPELWHKLSHSCPVKLRELYNPSHISGSENWSLAQGKGSVRVTQLINDSPVTSSMPSESTAVRPPRTLISYETYLSSLLLVTWAVESWSSFLEPLTRGPARCRLKIKCAGENCRAELPTLLITFPYKC